MLPAVRAAHNLGYSIIPVNREKKPLFAWKEYQNQRPTAEMLEKWDKEYSPAGWAIITGEVSGVIIIDFDGAEGIQTSKRLQSKPHTRTGSGGSHQYLEYPGWPVQTLNSKSKVEMGKLYPGLDIRADGGYAVFCGRNGAGEYQQLRDLTPDPLTMLPDDLKNYLGLSHPPKERGNGNFKQKTSNNGRVSIEVLTSRALDRVGTEGRNNAGFWLACQARDNGYSQSEAESAIQAYGDRVPETNTKGEREAYTLHDAIASVREAYRKPDRDPWNWNGCSNGQDGGEQFHGGEQPHLTDLGNAQRFLHQHPEDIRYCHAS